MPRTTVPATHYTLTIDPNNAVNFVAASSRYGKILNYAGLDSIGSYTIEYWFNSSGSNTNKPYVALQNGSTGLTISADGAGSETCNNNTVYSSSNAYIGKTSGWGVNGTWVHLAITHNASTKTMALYVDGLSSGSNFSATGSGTQNVATGADLYLMANSGLASFGNGKVACLRIWNSVRTATQLLAYKDYYLDPSQETGLILNCNFIEGTGTTVANTVSGSNNMSLVNTPAWTTGPSLTVWDYGSPRTAAGARTVAGTRTNVTI